MENLLTKILFFILSNACFFTFSQKIITIFIVLFCINKMAISLYVDYGIKHPIPARNDFIFIKWYRQLIFGASAHINCIQTSFDIIKIFYDFFSGLRILRIYWFFHYAFKQLLGLIQHCILKSTVIVHPPITYEFCLQLIPLQFININTNTLNPGNFDFSILHI